MSQDGSLISFCIPTYNRAPFLEALLRALVEDKGALPVEIVVSDNCSTDRTGKILEEYSGRHGVRYSRNGENLGAVRNVLKVMGMAKGEYLWILGDDDLIVPGITPYVTNLLGRKEEMAYLFVPRMGVDVNLNPLTGRTQPENLKQDVFFEDGRDMFMAFNGEMSDVMGFLSSTILRRDLWEDACNRYDGPVDNWIVLQVMLHILPGRRCCIPGKLGIFTRVGNSIAGRDSRIWLDEMINVYLAAMNLGYPPLFCEEKIRALFRGNAMKFVVNKAEGRRGGNLLSVGRDLGVEKLVERRFPFYHLSFLPKSLLRPALWARSARRVFRVHSRTAAKNS